MAKSRTYFGEGETVPKQKGTFQYQQFKKLLNRVAELEESFEELELQQLYGDRVDLPRDRWVAKPNCMSVAEFYETGQPGDIL